MNTSKIINKSKTIAIVGLSNKPGRYSYKVAKYLKDHGFGIVPVNPNITSVLGLKSYPSLLNIPHDMNVDIVDIFRRSKYVIKIVDQAIKIGAKTIWMHEEISNTEAAKKARRGGLEVVENVCIMRVHRIQD